MSIAAFRGGLRMSEAAAPRTTAARADLRRRLRRTSTRSALRALDLYSQGVAWRGTLLRPEVQAMRVMLDWQLTRPVLAADPATRVEQVRFHRVDGQVRGEWV